MVINITNPLENAKLGKRRVKRYILKFEYQNTLAYIYHVNNGGQMTSPPKIKRSREFNICVMNLQLSSKQKAAIEAGKIKRNRLIRATKQAASQLNLDEKPIHYYIYGPSGIGKTYQTEKAVKETGVITHTISGNVSMMALGINLAVIKYLNPSNKVVIIIDDCDEILKDTANINQFKGILDKNQYSYNKRFHINSVGEEGTLEHDAVLACIQEGRQGFTVDTSNFTFVITSNIKLAYDDTAEEGDDSKKAARARHLAAIRGRCETKDLDMTKEEKWGNLAFVTLEDGSNIDCDEQQKIFILEYIWNNWDNMTETSIRTVEKMARTLKLEGEEDIKDAFDADFLK